MEMSNMMKHSLDALITAERFALHQYIEAPNQEP